ncbi:MAG: CsbD family protein [Rhodospirillales bacterium]|nr:CsbD family protein [Rhodospirillales bacterium]
MDEDIITGGIERAAGRAERVAGALAGDPKTEIHGATRELGGATRQAIGETKDRIRRTVGGNSAMPFLAGASIGLIVGLFLTRR